MSVIFTLLYAFIVIVVYLLIAVMILCFLFLVVKSVFLYIKCACVFVYRRYGKKKVSEPSRFWFTLPDGRRRYLP